MPTRRTGGDLDKLVRAVMDALTQSGHLADDAQVSEIRATKRYAGDPTGGLESLHQAGVAIVVKPL